MSKEQVDSPKKYTADDIKTFLADIEEKVVESEGAALHSIVALNELVRTPNAEKLFTKAIKIQMKDLWVKLKSHGLQLEDPPILFGLPAGFSDEIDGDVETEDLPEFDASEDDAFDIAAAEEKAKYKSPIKKEEEPEEDKILDA